MPSDFIEKDKYNHIEPVTAHMAAFADIIERYYRRAFTLFKKSAKPLSADSL
jgi:hypothetical protein